MIRFNTKLATQIVKDVVNNTKFDYTQHGEIQYEARKEIYDYFGWSKSSVKFVNLKLNKILVDSGKLIPNHKY